MQAHAQSENNFNHVRYVRNSKLRDLFQDLFVVYCDLFDWETIFFIEREFLLALNCGCSL